MNKSIYPLLSKEATVIRNELLRAAKLTFKRMPLPNLKQASYFAREVSGLLTVRLMESIMTPDDRAWLNKDRSGETFEATIAQLTPGRAVHFSNEQQQISSMLSTLSGLSIDYLFIGEAYDRAIKNKRDAEAGMEVEHRQIALLDSYRATCTAIIDGLTKKPEEQSSLAALMRQLNEDPTLLAPERSLGSLLSANTPCRTI